MCCNSSSVRTANQSERCMHKYLQTTHVMHWGGGTLGTLVESFANKFQAVWSGIWVFKGVSWTTRRKSVYPALKELFLLLQIHLLISI